jgi:hypothetical protein
MELGTQILIDGENLRFLDQKFFIEKTCYQSLAIPFLLNNFLRNL